MWVSVPETGSHDGIDDSPLRAVWKSGSPLLEGCVWRTLQLFITPCPYSCHSSVDRDRLIQDAGYSFQPEVSRQTFFLCHDDLAIHGDLEIWICMISHET